VTEAFINRSMLRWARERSYPTVEEAAKTLKVNVDNLDAWEQGGSLPTFHQAQDLAKKLKIPFGYLYLSKPPNERLPLPDLRTRSGMPPLKPTPDFLEVLYDALRKQEWYREYLKSEGVERIPFLGRFNIKSHINDVAEDIRQVLRLDDSLRSECRNKDDFLNGFVQRAEKAGVLVMLSGIVANNTHRGLDEGEFQGFAIYDDIAPLVFINKNDFLSAQIFTLAHELAHIWIGLSGISNLAYLQKAQQQPHSYERVTDAIAAETLVPQDGFLLRWNGRSTIDENLENLTRLHCVSAFVILRRAYDLNKIDFQMYQSKYSELRTSIKPKKKGGGENTYPSGVFSRNSNTVTSTLLHSMAEGKVSPKEASDLLNVRMSGLRGLEQYLKQREPVYA